MARTPKVVEDRREQILDAALHVFAQKGYVLATNKDIAREAGITPGLIYHYFESKEAVLRAIIENRSPLRVIRALPPEALEQPSTVLLPILLRQILNVVESEEFVQLLRVLVPELVQHPEIAANGAQVVQQAINFLSAYLKTQMARGELRTGDAASAAQILVGSLASFVFRRQLLRDAAALSYSHEKIVKDLLDTFLGGLLPR